jgi:hypothetical protein
MDVISIVADVFKGTDDQEFGLGERFAGLVWINRALRGQTYCTTSGKHPPMTESLIQEVVLLDYRSRVVIRSTKLTLIK